MKTIFAILAVVFAFPLVAQATAPLEAIAAIETLGAHLQLSREFLTYEYTPLREEPDGRQSVAALVVAEDSVVTIVFWVRNLDGSTVMFYRFPHSTSFSSAISVRCFSFFNSIRCFIGG